MIQDPFLHHIFFEAKFRVFLISPFFPFIKFYVKKVGELTHQSLPAYLCVEAGHDMSLQKNRQGTYFSILKYFKRIPLCFIVLACVQIGSAQTYTIRGKIFDSDTRDPLQNVSVTVKSSKLGVLTDAEGNFTIILDRGNHELIFSYTGYRTEKREVSREQSHDISIFLSKSYTELEDVYVNAKRRKYSNKNNPAVELIRQVIAHKSINNPEAISYSSSEQYEKIRMCTDGPWGTLTSNFALKKLHFFFENTDSTIVEGKKLNSIYLQEIMSKNFHRKEPAANKRVVTGYKSVNYGEYVDMRGISGSLHFLYDDINIYDNTITAFTMQFTSPIANAAPTFYMYFIRDTLIEDGEKIVKIYFTPRNPEDLLFRGYLYVTLNGRYAVPKVELGVEQTY